MDLNMPELLAMDLESGVFNSMCMTAGAPPPRLAAEAYARQYSLRDFSFPRPESHHRQHMLAKMRSFGTADEYRRASASRHRAVSHNTKTIQGLRQDTLALPTGHPSDPSNFSFRNQERYRFTAGTRDAAAPAPVAATMYDDSTSESSYGEVAPPSIRCRQQSVTTTAATSVESARCSSALSHHKRTAAMIAATPVDRAHQESWMDFDADFTPNPYHQNMPGERTSWETDSFVGISHRRPNTSVGVRSLVNDTEGDIRDTASVTSVRIPKRRSSLSHRITVTKAESSAHSREESMVTCPSPAKSVTIHQPPPEEFGADRMAFPLPVLPVDLTKERISRKTPSRLGDYNDNGRSEPPSSPILASFTKPQTTTQQATLKPPQHQTPKPTSLAPTNPSQPPPRSPSTHSSTNVESWLESSVQLGLGRVTPPPPCREAIPTVGVPLPRALIDNLHIYVTGFPEVMLTPTCMVFETIRSHSRQMKRPCGGVGGVEGGAMAPIDEDVFRPDSVAGSKSGKKGRWNPLKRLTMGSKASSPTFPPPSPYGASFQRNNILPPSPVSPTDSELQTPAPGSLRPEGQRIKRVFGPDAPGYLCEALYAHILAYNYISMLLPAQTPPSAAGPSSTAAHARPDTPTSLTSEVADAKRVPKKAATLLGLDASSAGPIGAIHTRSQGSLAINTSVGRVAEPDPSVRILHAGLAGCIGLLVSTLRLVTGKEGGEEGKEKLDAEAKKCVDPVLLGALCEVVRCAEEVR